MVSDSGLLVTHVLFADLFWLLGKSWVESRVMAMELTVEVGRANFRWKRDSFMVMVGSRTPNKQQRSYAGSRRCAAGVMRKCLEETYQHGAGHGYFFSLTAFLPLVSSFLMLLEHFGMDY